MRLTSERRLLHIATDHLAYACAKTSLTLPPPQSLALLADVEAELAAARDALDSKVTFLPLPCLLDPANCRRTRTRAGLACCLSWTSWATGPGPSRCRCGTICCGESEAEVSDCRDEDISGLEGPGTEPPTMEPIDLLQVSIS